MKPQMNENEKRIVITCKKAVVDEAKAQGFERIDTYIQHLKAKINELEQQLNELKGMKAKEYIEQQLQQTNDTSKQEAPAPDTSTSGAAPDAPEATK